MGGGNGFIIEIILAILWENQSDDEDQEKEVVPESVTDQEKFKQS